MWFRIMYYVSIVICFATCAIVTFAWIKYLASERKEKNNSEVSEGVLE